MMERFSYTFSIEGDDAEQKMLRLIARAHALGSFSITQFDSGESVDAMPTTAHEQLFMLLAQQGPYRDKWVPYAASPKPLEVSQAAISQVLADHIQHMAGVLTPRASVPRRLKDMVSRALTGRTLSRNTLELFTAAFSLSTEDATKLWRLFEQGEGED